MTRPGKRSTAKARTKHRHAALESDALPLGKRGGNGRGMVHKYGTANRIPLSYTDKARYCYLRLQAYGTGRSTLPCWTRWRLREWTTWCRQSSERRVSLSFSVSPALLVSAVCFCSFTATICSRWHRGARKGPYEFRSSPSLSSVPKVALGTVPMFVLLNTDGSCPRRVESRPLPFSTLLSFWRSL